VWVEREVGLGVVHMLDMSAAADAVEAGTWVPQDVRSDELSQRFGFVRSPAAAAGGSSAH
jgi:hypothetical protein